ncbi:MAG: DUF3035 domain-containing protein [Alphaproteobacteria bacterium]|nr:DUF3035 domain-containing protein [Alphaproteobacteria bacterium]
MNIRSPHVVRAAVLVGVGLALSGCQTIRDAAGLEKASPDEFAVLTKAPLVVPPDYNLKPPRPGAAPTNQTEPADTAEAALFGSDPATIASNIPGDASEGEKLLLANAGFANADPAIRQHLQSDRKSMLGADDSFTDEILFWKGPTSEPGKVVDADAEAKRIAAQKAGQAPAQEQKPEAPKPEESKSGWFDGWFDWF